MGIPLAVELRGVLVEFQTLEELLEVLAIVLADLAKGLGAALDHQGPAEV